MPQCSWEEARSTLEACLGCAGLPEIRLSGPFRGRSDQSGSSKIKMAESHGILYETFDNNACRLSGFNSLLRRGTRLGLDPARLFCWRDFEIDLCTPLTLLGNASICRLRIDSQLKTKLSHCPSSVSSPRFNLPDAISWTRDSVSVIKSCYGQLSESGHLAILITRAS